jgi:hypothetical protein
MDKVLAVAEKVKKIVMVNPIAYGLGLVCLILLIILLSKREGFDALTEGVVDFAEYPKAFADVILPDFIKDVVYDNYFTKPAEKVEPNTYPSTQLELPSHEATVPIDIGNGLAVNAKVQIPGQTTEVPSQVPVSLPPAQVSDVMVPAQEIKIPAQTGVIPGAIAGSPEVLTVPVTIPEQIVSIPKQNAVIPTIEPFRM